MSDIYEKIKLMEIHITIYRNGVASGFIGGRLIKFANWQDDEELEGMVLDRCQIDGVEVDGLHFSRV